MKRAAVIFTILAVATFSLGLGYWIGFVSSSVQEKFETINSQLNELEKVNTLKFGEPITYGEQGFQLMRDHFNTTPSYRAALTRQIELGDTNAMKLKELFNTPYRSISSIGMSEKEIDAMMLIFFISKNGPGELNTSPLPATSPAKVRRMTDSLVKSLDKLKEEYKNSKLEESK
jgi:hypothetical protein